MEITLKAKNTDSKIVIAHKILDKMASYIEPNSKIFIVTDDNVFPLYYNKVEHFLNAAGFRVSHAVLASGEMSKSLENLNFLYGKCIKNKITRTDLIIALGGGVIGDITGFLAATYLRGVKLMQIPTTLLSQIDSSVGGKTAVNLEYGKNLAGVFYQPHTVLIDPTVLNTLSDITFADGVSEAIKYAYIRDKSLLELFLDTKQNILEIIGRCVNIKKDVVVNDEFDRGERMILNFGHTIGHAIEKAGNYTMYTHGQAVSLGMVAAAEISKDLYGFSGVSNIKEILQKNNLPIETPLSQQDCLKYIINDKKMEADSLNVILLKEIGQAVIHKMTANEFIELASKSSIWER